MVGPQVKMMRLKPADIDHIIKLIEKIMETLTKSDFLTPQEQQLLEQYREYEECTRKIQSMERLLIAPPRGGEQKCIKLIKHYENKRDSIKIPYDQRKSSILQHKLSKAKTDYIQSTLPPLQKKLALYLTPRWPQIRPLITKKLNLEKIIEQDFIESTYRVENNILIAKKTEAINELERIKATLEYNQAKTETKQKIKPVKELLLESVRKAYAAVDKLTEANVNFDKVTNEEINFAEVAVIEYLTRRFGEQDDALGNWPSDWHECPEAFDLYKSKIREFRAAEGMLSLQRATNIVEHLPTEKPTKTEPSIKVATKKKKRPTAADMEIRNKAVAMAAAQLQAKYDRLPSVDEVIAETKNKYTHSQIYATSAYKEGKIAKASAKLTTESTGSSITESEQFGERSIEHSRAKRRTKSDQADLDALIDQQEKDDSSDFVL
ncbi:MAG: hypothetical protein ACYS6W_11390 [Planctomycetota bacterium]|jgi:hypothetical protein